jgi:hypothetical protein
MEKKFKQDKLFMSGTIEKLQDDVQEAREESKKSKEEMEEIKEVSIRKELEFQKEKEKLLKDIKFKEREIIVVTEPFKEEIKTLKDEIVNKWQKEVHKMRTILKVRDDAIMELHATIKKKKLEVESKEVEIGRVKGEISKLRSTLFTE